MAISTKDSIKYKFGIIPFFNDFKLYLLLRYEAHQQHKRISALLIEVVSDAIHRANGNSQKLSSQESFYSACKDIADHEGISVAGFMEKSVAEYLNIRSVPVENKKKGSIFDLNRDVRK
jgi:hypothetical protein